MAIRPKKTRGKTLSVGKIKRKQKRRKRRLVEAADQDWARWDEAAEGEGVNFAEFARRALNNYVFLLGLRQGGMVGTMPVPSTLRLYPGKPD